MAIDIRTTDLNSSDRSSRANGSEFSLWEGVKTVLAPVASLKLTVALFALSIVLIFVGTLAQVDKDIWEVIGLYFRCWIAWVPVQVFVPPSFVIANEVRDAQDKLLEPTYWLMGLIPLGSWKADNIPGGFWFPGGALIGALLGANLLSAHLIRFKAEARGTRLLAGLAAIAVGGAATWFVIAAGSNSKGIQAEPFIPYSTLWIGFVGSLAMLGLASAYAAVQQWSRPVHATNQAKGWFVRGLLAVVSVGLVVLVGWLFSQGDAVRPSDSALRILWQLTQATFAGAALLAGCWVVFKKRAGVVLLHAGIGLMMYYELHVSLTAIETQMNLEEGETSSFVHDIRTFELAVIDKTDPKSDRVVAIPRSLLLDSAPTSATGVAKPIDFAELPFTVEITRFEPNSHLRAASSQDANPATTGLGVEWFAESKRPGSGTDADSKVDMATAYVTLKSRDGGKPLGTYLVGMLLSMSGETDTVAVGDKVYELSLRAKRYYKDYRFTLKDVRNETYIGTSTPRSYASTTAIVDPTRNVDEEKTIWMNNPLRFANETFYQSGYHKGQDGAEHTTLSVVANTGWMMPYVSCMLVAIGMLAHFLILLVRFLTRGDEPDLVAAPSTGAMSLKEKLGIKPAQAPLVSVASALESKPASQWLSVAVTATIVLVCAGYIGSKARPPKSSPLEYDLAAFGRIPVVQDGRAKPLDSAARSALLEISGKTTVTVGHGKDVKYVPAIQWLLDVIAENDTAENYGVFRIENLELHETMGVKKRDGMRYSRKELRPRFKLTEESLALLRDKGFPPTVLAKLEPLKDQRLSSDDFRDQLTKLLSETEFQQLGGTLLRVSESDEFQKQVANAREVAKKDRRLLSVYQRKVLQLSDKLSTFDNIQFAFGLHHRVRGETPEEVIESFQMVTKFEKMVAEQGQPIMAVGSTEKDQPWRTLAGAWLENTMNMIRLKQEPNPNVTAWDDILKAYSKDEKKDFNRAVEAQLSRLTKEPPQMVQPARIRFEAFFNQFQPFSIAVVLYVFAFVLSACGWLGWTQGFNRAAFWLQVLILALHTFALVGRIYISGRPPVTNLYSSAIFIGWASVVLGLVLELIYRIGIGSLIASVAGYATLLIADSLSVSGDTFTVLQAVLDTQFWLATHVTCITFGYATTYLAGLLGIVYVVRGVFTPSLTRDIGRDLNRMIYGTLCFSIFFSFVGTVLGGLWADDSWGRFWGWDPKENGALIIVLWNALALHARWGGLVKERGLAVLAIAGNIFVSWSWWGVNELGAGLHSYGFTEGTIRNLGLCAVAHLALIAIGSLPKSYWRSSRNTV